MLISILVILSCCAASGWFMLQSVRRWNTCGPTSRATLVACMTLGLTLGICATFFFQYRWKPTMRVAGFPFPVAFFILEENRWTDFVLPPLMTIGVIIANILLWITALLGIGRLLIYFFKPAQAAN